MARIYEFPEDETEVPDLEGSRFQSFDPATRKALIKFWIAAPGIVIAAFLLYYLSRGRIEPSYAIIGAVIVAIFALVLLFMMNRSLLSMHVISSGDHKIARHLDKNLSQLDDRFAIFHNGLAGDHRIDHIIVGPSGVYTVKSSATLDNDGWTRAGDIELLLEEDKAVSNLIDEILPQANMPTQAVLCVPEGSTVRIEQDNRGVWVVAADKLAVSLIKRSTSEGAIAPNINETGAFSNDRAQAQAIERALANHWNMPTRRNRTDFIPPDDLTAGDPSGQAT